MPHLILEYSGTIAADVKATNLLGHAHDAMLASGVFNAPDVKSRAYVADDFLVGNDGMAGSFIHARVYLLEGRTQQQKALVVDGIFAVLQTYGSYASQLSVDIRDMGRSTYRKHVA